MKKRRFLFGFLLAILTAFTFASRIDKSIQTHAAGVVTVTFNANGGECATSSMQTNDSGTLSSLPTPTKPGYIFECWLNGEERVSTSTVFDEDTTITALYHMQIFEYTISKSSTYSVVGKTLDNDFTYTLSTSCATLEDALLIIKNDLTNESKATTINFENISLEKDLDLNFQNLTLSGTLSLGEFSVNYTTPVQNSILNLKSLSLNSTSSQNLLNISGNHRVSMEISNAKFNSTQNSNNYALFFTTSSTSIIARGKISHETAFLYNHTSNTSSQMHEVDISEQANGYLSIAIPYNSDGSTVVTTSLSSSYFKFIPQQNNYTCRLVKNGVYLQVVVNFDLKFNPNEGTMDQSLETIESRFNQTTKLQFPTESSLTKQHFTLNGFAGKITLTNEQMTAFATDTSVWYFDKTMLDNFLENAVDYADIKNYFSSTLPAANNNGFTYYKNDSSFTDPDFLAVLLMLDLNQTPEFVALWSDTIYNITFETNGGLAVSNISGVYNSVVVLPTTSKTGYRFDGWYSSSDFAEGTLKTPSNFSQMPGESLTLYAKWTADTHNLTIYPNNGQSEIVTNVPYNIALSTVNELSEGYLTKTGYSFVGWFEDEGLSAEKEIADLSTYLMPNNNISIYAKWQVNQYTITLNTNHAKDNSDYRTLTVNYGADITSLKTSNPSFEGYTFKGWLTSSLEKYNSTYPYIPSTMPAEDLTLYGSWDKISYKLYFYLNNNTLWERMVLNFEDKITTPKTPVVSGYIFNGWFTNPELTEQFALNSMPSRDVSVYAHMLPKKTIEINQESQSYGVSSNNGFILNSKLANFTIEYLVNDKWQTNYPTKKGSYDVRITRYEDAQYNAVNIIIENGYSVVSDSVDITLYCLILYAIAFIEIVASIIILVLRKHRQSYLTYAVSLPFGLVSNSDFINLIISLILAVFGLILFIMQYTKLKKVNNEIAKVSDENKGYKPPDVSTNDSISSNVDQLLKQEGFAFEKQKNESKLVEIGFDDESNDSVNQTKNSSNTDATELDSSNQEHDSPDDKLDIDSL